MSAELDVSRLPRSNSVNSATAEEPASEENRTYDEQVIEDAKECVAEFREKYPYLAEQPMSSEPGQRLRECLVREEFETEYVEPEGEFEQGHTVERLARAEAVTWAEGLFKFLVERQPYDDGIGGKFRDRESDETFTKDFHDCWTTEYGEKQAARNSAAERQLMGGSYPDNEESARAGEFEDDHEWTGDTATIMLTLTGSSVPNDERMPPVDHSDSVTRTWSRGNVYQTVRNICEKELGLESDQWGFVRGDDVHGMGEPEHATAGENACYAHSHPAIYIDLGETGLRDEFETDFEIKSVLEAKYHKAVKKHVEECDVAKPEAHTRENAVRVRLDLENPSGYATEYLRLDEDEMMEMPVEFQAFAAVEWATNRQRIARSKLFTDAAKADFCKQDEDSTHGETVIYDRSGHGEGEVVCADCGSGVGIEADTLAQHRLSEVEESEDDGMGQVQVGVKVGESTGAARTRSRVESHVEQHGEPGSVAVLMGDLGIAPQYRSVVEEVLAGEDSSSEVEPVMGEPPGPRSQYDLEAVVMPDGGEEEVTDSSGGGVSMTALKLPDERLLRETRLKFAGSVSSVKIVATDGDERFATKEPELVARWLVNHGYRRPWHAEMVLSFERFGSELPEILEEPYARPPPCVGNARRTGG